MHLFFQLDKGYIITKCSSWISQSCVSSPKWMLQFDTNHSNISTLGLTKFIVSFYCLDQLYHVYLQGPSMTKDNLHAKLNKTNGKNANFVCYFKRHCQLKINVSIPYSLELSFWLQSWQTYHYLFNFLHSRLGNRGNLIQSALIPIIQWQHPLACICYGKWTYSLLQGALHQLSHLST